MKTKRWMLILVMLVVCIVSWYLAVLAASGIETKEYQKLLVEEADKLASKELYVRAIPAYQKALEYTTDANTEIETRLMESYLAFGEYDSYAAFVEKRVIKGTATEKEYLTVAQYYIDNMRLEKAMELLQKGIQRLDSAALEDMYEANRYGYSLRLTNYEEIIPTADNSYMPAFDGKKWGYIDSTGRVQTAFQYDLALPFNSRGYGVVSYNGKYYVITKSGARYGVDETGITDVYAISYDYILAQVNGSYSYYNFDFQCITSENQYEEITANACGLAAVKKNGFWGIITDGGSVVVDFILEDVAVNSLGAVYSNNTAMVQMDGKWYLVDTKGRKISETGYFGAKAPESEGFVAVSNEEGKWGFINRQGELVIDYQYDDAYSFSQHLAAVQIGADWGYISEKNKLVIEQFMRDAKPFHNGIAQAKFVDGEGLLILDYFEK